MTFERQHIGGPESTPRQRVPNNESMTIGRRESIEGFPVRPGTIYLIIGLGDGTHENPTAANDDSEMRNGVLPMDIVRTLMALSKMGTTDRSNSLILYDFPEIQEITGVERDADWAISIAQMETALRAVMASQGIENIQIVRASQLCEHNPCEYNALHIASRTIIESNPALLQKCWALIPPSKKAEKELPPDVAFKDLDAEQQVTALRLFDYTIRDVALSLFLKRSKRFADQKCDDRIAQIVDAVIAANPDRFRSWQGGFVRPNTEARLVHLQGRSAPPYFRHKADTGEDLARIIERSGQIPLCADTATIEPLLALDPDNLKKYLLKNVPTNIRAAVASTDFSDPQERRTFLMDYLLKNGIWPIEKAKLELLYKEANPGANLKAMHKALQIFENMQKVPHLAAALDQFDITAADFTTPQDASKAIRHMLKITGDSQDSAESRLFHQMLSDLQFLVSKYEVWPKEKNRIMELYQEEGESGRQEAQVAVMEQARTIFTEIQRNPRLAKILSDKGITLASFENSATGHLAVTEMSRALYTISEAPLRDRFMIGHHAQMLFELDYFMSDDAARPHRQFTNNQKLISPRKSAPSGPHSRYPNAMRAA